MPTIIAEYGGLERVSELLSQFNARRIFLVTGRGSFEACGAKGVLEHALSDYEVEQFSEFDPNPKLEDGLEGARRAEAFCADLILSVGGGSPMDVAKLIKAFLPDLAAAEDMVRGKIPMPDSDMPLICVPTTAGSGSESTHFAVVYIDKDKFSLASPALLPDGVILDGKLLRTASSYQRAVNGLDALAQATEGAWAAKSTTASRALSFAAIETLLKHLPDMVEADDAVALQAVIVAANKAGQVINVTKTTAPHAFSYAFTSYHNIPHGHAVWMTLPAIFALHMHASDAAISDPRGVEYFRNIMSRLATLYELDSVAKAEDKLKAFMKSIGAEPEMSVLGAKDTEQRKFLSARVNRERMGNNPVVLSDADIASVFSL